MCLLGSKFPGCIGCDRKCKLVDIIYIGSFLMTSGICKMFEFSAGVTLQNGLC